MGDNNLTTEDAITVLRNLQDWLYFSSMNGGTSIQREAIDMAIKALKSQPSAEPNIAHIIAETMAECGIYGEEATIKMIGTLKRIGRDDLIPPCAR